MERFRAIVAYDGAGYHGFQRLSGGAPSVQAAIEAALTRINGGPVEVIGAGRTDAGVHATGQVIAFEMSWRHTEADLLRAINATLPNDIAVQQLSRAAPGFHPRYDARSRAYCYRVYAAPQRQPLLERLAWQVRVEPDVALMNEAAALLIGTHDFASFGTPPRGESGTTRRTVFEARWEAEPPRFGVPILAFHIEADAFLYRMVRSVVGALIEVGTAHMTVQAFEAAFRAHDRARIGVLAPPHGLTLAQVSYDPVSDKTDMTDAGRRPLGA